MITDEHLLNCDETASSSSSDESLPKLAPCSIPPTPSPELFTPPPQRTIDEYVSLSTSFGPLCALIDQEIQSTDPFPRRKPFMMKPITCSKIFRERMKALTIDSN